MHNEIIILLSISNVMLLFLLFKKNHNIVVNNVVNVPKGASEEPKNLESRTDQAMVGNEKVWPRPADKATIEPPEAGNLFNNPIPSFKDKPKPAGFGDIKNG